MTDQERKQMYERKQSYVENLMSKNARVDTLTEEQHNALESLCTKRHEFHSSTKKMFYSEVPQYEYWNWFDGEINDELSKAGLPTIDFPDTTEIPCDADYELLSDEEQEEWERKVQTSNHLTSGFAAWFEYSDVYDEYCDICESINKQIEDYLRAIDEEYGTHYAPTGCARNKN